MDQCNSWMKFFANFVIAMTKLPKTKVRSVGVSNHTVEHVSHLSQYFLNIHSNSYIA